MRPFPKRIRFPRTSAYANHFLYSRSVLPVLIVFMLIIPESADAISNNKRVRETATGAVASLGLGGGTPAQVAGTLRLALDPSGTAVKKSSHDMTFPRDENTETPIFLDRDTITHLSRTAGKPAERTSPAETALDFIALNYPTFLIKNPDRELAVISEEKANDGRLHIQFGQSFQGLPVYGQRLTMHFDADGAIYAMNGRYSPTPSGVDVSDIRTSKADILEEVADDLSGKTEINEVADIQKLIPAYSGPVASLVIMPRTEDREPLVAWFVSIRPNLKENWRYFLDARSGAIIEAYNTVMHQTLVSATATDALGESRTFTVTQDNSVYYLMSTDTNIMIYDAHGKVIEANSDVTLVTSTDNTWDDTSAVSAYWNGTQTYNYYLTEHNRNGIDGQNMETPIVVHYTPDGQPYDNAFWAGEYMAFGDARPYISALDVVAHEMTHGVVQFTVGLEYRYQSGALNEAIADVMACMVDPDWLVGEDLPGGAFRDLENPENFGLPADMDHYQEMSLNEDNGGVHINMSIPSRAWALTANTIGRDKAAGILYRVLTSLYLTSQSQFVDMRLAAVQSATDLFGADSEETAAVKSSFDTAGILEGAATQPSEDTPPPDGGEWIAFVENNGDLMLGKPQIANTEDILTLSRTGVFAGTGRPIANTRDGKLIVYVDKYNDLRSIDLETYQETLLSNTGNWFSVALSPDGGKLAATSVYIDTTIYIFDLDTPENSKQVTLYTPSTEAGKSPTMLYADALEWDLTGTQILFDAYNNFPSQDGSVADFWNINLLDVESEVITHVATPTENDLQVGNPSYAETNNRYIVCDLFSESINYNAIVTFDLFTHDRVELKNNGFATVSGVSYANVGIPRYSTDDKTIIFQQYDPESSSYYLYTIPLADDKMNAEGSAEFYHSGEIPVWFVLGTTTVVEETEESAPVAFTLGQNFPNPFNPFTTIPFTLTRADQVVLSVHNILGQEVATLVNEIRPAGNYSVQFDGSQLASGIYLYRLRANSAMETRKMRIIK